MATALSISLNDQFKKAVCKETVALCAKYNVTVEPALAGAGKLVLHRRHTLYSPKGVAVENGGYPVAQGADKWDANEVYGVVDLTTTDGVTSGTLELRYELLVRDFVGKYGVGAEAPLKFAVYGTSEEGLLGDGEFNVKVVEPYYVASDQSFVLFKGDKGNSIRSIVYKSSDESGNWTYRFIFTDNSEIDVKIPCGPAGVPASGTYAYNETTHKYHKINVVVNGLGQYTVKVDPTGIDTPPADAGYVSLGGSQVITGFKKFTGGINVTGDLEAGNIEATMIEATGTAKVPTVADTTDSSTRAASTAFVHNAIEAASDDDDKIFQQELFATPISNDKYIQVGGVERAWMSKSDYPDAYAKVQAMLNGSTRTGTYSYRPSTGSLNGVEAPEIDHTNKDVTLVSGSYLSYSGLISPVFTYGDATPWKLYFSLDLPSVTSSSERTVFGCIGDTVDEGGIYNNSGTVAIAGCELMQPLSLYALPKLTYKDYSTSVKYFYLQTSQDGKSAGTKLQFNLSVVGGNRYDFIVEYNGTQYTIYYKLHTATDYTSVSKTGSETWMEGSLMFGLNGATPTTATSNLSTTFYLDGVKFLYGDNFSTVEYDAANYDTVTYTRKYNKNYVYPVSEKSFSSTGYNFILDADNERFAIPYGGSSHVSQKDSVSGKMVYYAYMRLKK